jgi:hypothetical protein
MQGAGKTNVVDPGVANRGGGDGTLQGEEDAVSSVELGNNRDLAHLRKAQRTRDERLSQGSDRAIVPDPRKEFQKSPNCSTYHTSYNIRDEHPEMFAE